MKVLKALLGGLAGACAVTVLHQMIKKNDSEAPRMDLLGMESLTKILDKVGVEKPEGKKLYYMTMGGDIISNSIYYSMAGIGDTKTVLKGVASGLAAGLAAVFLPKHMGLNEQHSNRTRETQILAVLYYLTGGLVSSAVMKLLNGRDETVIESVKDKAQHLSKSVL